MIIVDTTVLVYAVGVEHPLRAPCRALIAAVEASAVRATTTIEVVQEFAHVRAKRRPRRDAADLARSYAELFAPLLVVDTEDLLAGLRLFQRSEVLGTFDAVLAATAMRRSARGLVSADTSFAKVRGLRHIDPANSKFTAQLETGR